MVSRPWFKAKTYGYGWYPCSWYGWIIIAIYVFLLLLIFRLVDVSSHSASDTLFGMIAPFVVLTLLLIVICYRTGEKPRWRWGLNG